MSIKQEIYDLIELTKVSKIPILILSNPGYAKTTNIKTYADENGYHLETLIGSRFNPDDIMGYQVNDPNSNVLIQKDPMWFDRIMNAKENGKPSILFIDELSTCSDLVQGSLLSLIFDRAIGNGKKLPEDCLILSAANYSQNLPDFMNIMSPTLNRFCIINLLEGYNNNDILQEFLTAPKEVVKRTILEVDEQIISESFLVLIKSVIAKYSDVSSSLGFINLQNQEISEMYKNNKVYNVMTGRSIYYLKEMVIALAKLGIYQLSMIRKIVGGLIGLGSNNFQSDTQVGEFINLVSNELATIVSSSKLNSVKKTFNKSVRDEVNDYILSLEKTNLEVDFNYLENLVEYISGEYQDPIKVFEKAKNGDQNSRNAIAADLDAILLLFDKTQNSKLVEIHQSNSWTYGLIFNNQNVDFDYWDYQIYKPKLFRGIVLAKDKKGEVGRYGFFGSNDSKLYFKIPNEVRITEAVTSRPVKGDEIQIFTLD